MRVVNTGVVRGGHDCLLRVAIVLSGVSRAVVVATQAGAEGVFS